MNITRRQVREFATGLGWIFAIVSAAYSVQRWAPQFVSPDIAQAIGPTALLASAAVALVFLGSSTVRPQTSAPRVIAAPVAVRLRQNAAGEWESERLVWVMLYLGATVPGRVRATLPPGCKIEQTESASWLPEAAGATFSVAVHRDGFHDLGGLSFVMDREPKSTDVVRLEFRPRNVFSSRSEEVVVRFQAALV